MIHVVVLVRCLLWLIKRIFFSSFSFVANPVGLTVLHNSFFSICIIFQLMFTRSSYSFVQITITLTSIIILSQKINLKDRHPRLVGGYSSCLPLL